MSVIAFPMRTGVDTTLDEYREWMAAKGLASCTIDQRLAFAARVHHEWGSFNQTPAHVGRWLAGYYGWTNRTYLRHLRAIYAWQIECGHLEADPTRAYRMAPMPRPKPRPLTAGEFAAAMALADDRARAWLLLGKLAGLRAHEIAKIHGHDIDEGALFVRGKGRQEALLPTHPALWELAQGYPRDGYWFPSTHGHRDHVHESLVGNVIRDLFRSAGITRGATHRLRATYGTELRRSGADMRVVQELLRHRSLTTTEHYLGVEASELSEAIGRLAA